MQLRHGTYLALLASLAILCHLVNALSVVVATDACMTTDHYICQLRVFEQDARLTLFDRAVHIANQDARPQVLVIGDSQTYGFHVPHRDSFSAILQRRLPAMSVYNLSIIDARPRDIVTMLRSIEAGGRIPDVIILNINPSHFSASFVDVARLGGRMPLIELLARDPYNLYYGLFARKGDEISSSEQFVDQVAPTGYFPMDLDAFTPVVEEELRLAKSLARQVIVFVAPSPLDAIHTYGFDADGYLAMVDRISSLCVKNHIVPLDVSRRFTIDDFLDIAHFNHRGHEMMARMIAAKIIDSKSLR